MNIVQVSENPAEKKQRKQAAIENLNNILTVNLSLLIKQLIQLIVEYVGDYCECICHSDILFGCTNKLCEDGEVCGTIQVCQQAPSDYYLIRATVQAKLITQNDNTDGEKVVLFFEFNNGAQYHIRERDNNNTIMCVFNNDDTQTLQHGEFCVLTGQYNEISLLCKYDKSKQIAITNCEISASSNSFPTCQKIKFNLNG